jgi:hypothetical protein
METLGLTSQIIAKMRKIARSWSSSASAIFSFGTTRGNDVPGTVGPQETFGWTFHPVYLIRRRESAWAREPTLLRNQLKMIGPVCIASDNTAR